MLIVAGANDVGPKAASQVENGTDCCTSTTSEHPGVQGMLVSCPYRLEGPSRGEEMIKVLVENWCVSCSDIPRARVILICVKMSSKR